MEFAHYDPTIFPTVPGSKALCEPLGTGGWSRIDSFLRKDIQHFLSLNLRQHSHASLQERHIGKSTLIKRLFTGRKGSVNLLLQSSIINRILQKIIPQIGQDCRGSVGPE